MYMFATNLALFVEVRLIHNKLYKRIDPGVVHRNFFWICPVPSHVSKEILKNTGT